MKKIFASILASICVLSTMAFSGCEILSGLGIFNEDDGKPITPTCVHKAGEEIYYEESGGIVTISYQCVKCEKGSDEIIETVKADAVIYDTDKNGLSIAQERIDNDMVICLKKGNYSQIYMGDKKKAVRVLCEEGVEVKVAQLNGDADRVTFENANFISDPELKESASIFKFEPASGNRYWSNITIKNCHFEGNAYIDSAWKTGVVDNLTVDNCTFKNTTDDYGGQLQGSAKSSIFIDEAWGTTTIKNCTFDTPEFNGIRLGRVSVEGEIIIENCVFRNTRRQSSIYIVIKSGIVISIENCIFDEDFEEGVDTCPILCYTSSLVQNTDIYVGKNTWKIIPSVIPNATYYNKFEQSSL